MPNLVGAEANYSAAGLWTRLSANTTRYNSTAI